MDLQNMEELEEFFNSKESVLSKVALPLDIIYEDIPKIVRVLIQNSAYRIYIPDMICVEKFLEENPIYEKIVIPVKKETTSDPIYGKILDFCSPLIDSAENKFEEIDVRDVITLLHNLHFASKVGADLFVHWSLNNFTHRLSLLTMTNKCEYEIEQITGLLNLYKLENNLPVLTSIVKPGFEHRLFDMLLRKEYYELSKLNYKLGTLSKFKNPLVEIKKIKADLQMTIADLYNVTKQQHLINTFQAPIDVILESMSKFLPKIEDILRVLEIIPTDYTPPIRTSDPYLIAAGFEYSPSLIAIG